MFLTLASLLSLTAVVPLGSRAHEALVPTADLRPNAMATVQSCAFPTGRWGDVSDDGAVNIIDAQQIARHTVGLTVTNLTAVTGRGDVTADNSVDIVDAQQVARFTVGLAAAARINALLVPLPSVAAVVITPATASLIIGSTRTLVAEARDSLARSLTGCVPVSWSSTTPVVATVSTTGVVTAVSAGTASIQASASGVTGSASITVTTGSGGGSGGGGNSSLYVVRDSVVIPTQGLFIGAASATFSRIAMAPYSDLGSTTRNLIFFDSTGTILAQHDVGGSSWAVAMTPDGSRTVAGSDDENLYFFQGTAVVSTGRPNPANTQIRGVAISDDGRWVGAGGARFTLHDWNASNRVVPVFVDSSTTQLRAIDFSANGRLVAYGGRFSTTSSDPGTTYIAVYDLVTGARIFRELIPCPSCSNAELRQLAISPDGSRILAGDWGGRLHYFTRDGSTNNWTRSTQSVGSRVYWVDMNADGTRAAVGVQESGVRLFSLGTSATQLWERTGTDGGQRTVHITPDGRYITASTRGGGGGGGQIVVHDSTGTQVLSRASYAVNTGSGWKARGGVADPEAWFARVSDDGSRALLASYEGILYFFTRR